METWKAAIIARDLMNHHGLDHWRFRYYNATSTFGLCSYSDTTLYFSEVLVNLNHEDDVIDTILHEIAHALLPAGYGHSKAWRFVAKNIGYTGKRCYPNHILTPKRIAASRGK